MSTLERCRARLPVALPVTSRKSLCNILKRCVSIVRHRFYAEQRAHDQSAGDPLREDIKRMQRQAKERQQEAQMLDSMYQVCSTVSHLNMVPVFLYWQNLCFLYWQNLC